MLILVLVGLVAGIAGFGDAMLLLKGETINLNEASITDFEESKMIEGELYYPVGLLVTYEETRTTYGIPTGKTTTYYYLMGNIDYKTYDSYIMDDEDFDDYYVIFSTSDEDLVKKIDALGDKWNDYYDGEDYTAYPTEGISFAGKTAPQPTDSDYIKYRDECYDEWGFKQTEVANYRIVDGKLGVANYALFFGGIAVFVIGLIGLIASLVSSKKKKREELY